jgi:FKBP-type peptidyl-prolyl cis-trans isomerase (trigger factor)
MSTKIINKETSTDVSVLAKENDGTIQITFTIPFSKIQEERQKALTELSGSVNVAGFRKGKAPLDRVMENVSQNKLLEKTLSHILPDLLAKSIKKHNIKPIIYPKFQLIKAEEGKDWEVRAITCEAPEINLGDYKKIIQGEAKANAIWTPGSPVKSENNKQKEPTTEEKEQKVLKVLLSSTNVTIPKILIQDEVDNRLSNLLSHIEKLGLTLESYLASTGKTAEQLRSDYEKVSAEGLTIDFILTKIAEEEKIKVDEKDIEKALSATPKEDTPNLGSEQDRKRLIDSILKRRKALDYLISLF